MATIFSRIMGGELPGRFVWSDPQCTAFLTINPITPGHTLVVPRAEIDHWIDLPVDLAAHLVRVAHAIGKAIETAYATPRVALVVAGFEVPHAHLHVIGARSMRDLDFRNAERSPQPAALDAAATKLREALRAAGHAQASDQP
jgi:diadenosine tetraphosphate (Ap4A) HIT family hydrolase